MKYLLLVAMLFSFHANALPTYTGKIKSILIGDSYQSKLFIEVDGDPSSTPSCQANSTYDFVLDGSSEAGKMYISVILTAYTAGKEVVFSGYDKCDIYTGVTTFRSIRVL